MLARKALAGTAGAPKVYVEDVFSTYLYTGTGATQTITNNIDLSTEGGLVWIKERTSVAGAVGHQWTDTARGYEYQLRSDSTAAQTNEFNRLTSFNTNGFTLGNSSNVNANTGSWVSFSFRKAKKFFDVVTYTGNGSLRTISHNLGSVPGCIIVKATGDTGNWPVYHRGLNGGTNPQNYKVFLNTTNAQLSGTNDWNDTAPTSTVFTVNTSSDTNANGVTYVAYLFAHDAGGFGDAGSDSIISCGSFSGNADVNLGWEAQWVLIKDAGNVGEWYLFDNMRGMAETDGRSLSPNTSGAESNVGAFIVPTATGFKNVGGGNYIYIAIRRGPMKTPTSGTSVFNPVVYTGTNVDNRLIDTTIAPDMVMIKERNDTVAGMVTGDRLRGNPYLLTGSTAAEVNDADSLMTPTSGVGNAFSAMNGVGVGNDATSKVNIDTTSNNHIAWAFKRAPGFFDVVCYTGTGSARTVAHNLGVVPELMIVKRRNGGAGMSWAVYTSTLGNTGILFLDSTGTNSGPDTQWNSTTPTSSVFSLGSNTEVNANGGTFVAYLFASLSGISKIGSYSGNGSNQTINCGFTNGVRLVLIKSQSGATGDWVVFDSARGIVSGDDPYLRLNSTAAEVTNKDAVDTDNTGFVVNETTGPNVNTSGVTYLYLAIA